MNNGKICVSVCAETANEFIEKIERTEQLADIIELRFDCLKEDSLEFTPRQYEFVLSQLKKEKNQLKPLLVTMRPLGRHGGKTNASLDERINFWKELFETKIAKYVDFEEGFSFDLVNQNFLNKLSNYKLISSYHDFEGGLFDAEKFYNYFTTATKANIYKIALQSHDATDGLTLMKLLERAKTENKDLIPIAMGEYGMWTRILGLSRGAFMTFASLDDESATAPGQLAVQEMIDVYRVKELDADTEIYGLVAGSTAHSVSPQMHNAAFKYHNLNAVYVPFAVKNLEEFMRRMVNPKTREIDWKLRGLSVTLPHKVEIMKYLDFVDETAQKIGAVNTVKIEGDKLLGFNTDAQGFIEPLKNSYGDVRGCKVAVLGAGGAARACVYALKEEGAEVTVFARDVEKAKSLAADFDVQISDFNVEDFNGFDILVNATPLGMKKGGLEDEAPAKTVQLGGLDLVYDLIYNPFTTKLMREAQAVFVPTLGGLAMLVAQAMAQQKIWTGLDAPMKEMSAAALKKLE